MKELIFKSAQSIADVDESQGIVKGLGSVFGNVDSDGDVMVKGAFKDTIQENRNRIKYLYQHRIDKPIGTMKELNETSEGLEFVSQIAVKTALGKDVFEMIKAGVITENSVGFATINEKFDSSAKVNYINKVKLYEISAVTLAANPLAFINEVKSKTGMQTKEEMIREYLNEKFDALESLLKANISDELGLAVEFEIKSLKELALGQVPEKKSKGKRKEAKAEGDVLHMYDYLIKNL